MSENKAVANITIERPRICCIDLSTNIISELRKKGANVYEGTLGPKVIVPNSYIKEHHHLLLHNSFPENLHEYDIIIIDLNSFKTIEYNPHDHERKHRTGTESKYLLSSYPENLFDPRPLACSILHEKLQEIKNRKYLLIVFACESYDVEYKTITIENRSAKIVDATQFNIYSFWKNVPTLKQKIGKEIEICEVHVDLQNLLEKTKQEVVYHQTFNHPLKWNGKSHDHDTTYLPLMKNLNGEIISFIQQRDTGDLFMLPQVRDKKTFLIDFLEKIAPSFYPELFPFSTTLKWKESGEYFLPNHLKLIEEKRNIQLEFNNKLKVADDRLTENISKFSFLHELLCETGDNLVKAVITYLKWLGFNSVSDFDSSKSSSSILEEDIQVELDNGLLIIECKGIGGTSTDSNCSQISKIKHRRCRERKKFDVFALYIVNHQRFLPPLQRKNPPFTDHQIQDAKNDERGILSTWQLFNLYFDIENDIITKEDARSLILIHGLIEFRPLNLIHVYEPTEFFLQGEVCIVKIDGITLSVNDELFVEKSGKFQKVKILEIKENGIPRSSASKEELGLKLSNKIRNNSILWKQNIHT